MLDNYFGITKSGSSMRVEILAGITTFFASAYIILVNPSVLSQGETNIFNGVFFATCIGSAIGTFLMAFYARIPFAQAPGMGLNAFFAYTAIPSIAAFLATRNLSKAELYHMALPLVLYSGVIFIIISAVGIREKIINGIPMNIKMALTGGIGLFIAYLGLQNAGIIVPSPATQVTLINFADYAGNSHAIHGAILTLLGLFIITILSSLRVKGAVLLGIIITTVLAFVTGYATIPDHFSFDISQQARDFVDVSLFKLDFLGPFTHGNLGAAVGTMLALILAFAMVNIFDSMATIFGVCQSANMVEENGEVRGLKKGLMADATGTAIGALLGTSTVTTVVESATGIGEGGRTGMTSFVTGILFLVALVFAPLIVLIPSVATAPALIYVGCLMMGSIKAVDFSEPTDAVPAFLTIIMMPLTYSIANGIAFGLISFVVVKLLTGRTAEIKAPTVVVAALFVLQFVLR
ncbi:MAG: NCS2 family permease [Planctomycetaceae bacterium]|nr:NCS2 family permease [Planctomycetaceae bacterium]